jgi:hypothetical protein
LASAVFDFLARLPNLLICSNPITWAFVLFGIVYISTAEANEDDKLIIVVFIGPLVVTFVQAKLVPPVVGMAGFDLDVVKQRAAPLPCEKVMVRETLG